MERAEKSKKRNTSLTETEEAGPELGFASLVKSSMGKAKKPLKSAMLEP